MFQNCFNFNSRGSEIFVEGYQLWLEYEAERGNWGQPPVDIAAPSRKSVQAELERLRGPFFEALKGVRLSQEKAITVLKHLKLKDTAGLLSEEQGTRAAEILKHRLPVRAFCLCFSSHRL